MFFNLFLIACFLLFAMNPHAMSVEMHSSMDSNSVFVLPDSVQKDEVIEQLNWQGLPMKIEFFTVHKPIDIFLQEIAMILPEGALLKQHDEGHQISWRYKNISYLLMLEPLTQFDSSESGTTPSFKGIYSVMIMNNQAPSSKNNACNIRWLPDDAQLIFSMGDQTAEGHPVRIEGFVSSLSMREASATIELRLKNHGWLMLAKLNNQSSQGKSTQLEALCGNRHARINLHKKSFQTRISVMSIEK